MKKFKLYLLCVLSLLTIVSTSFANSIVLTETPYSYAEGGEFKAVTSNNGTFQTFCVQPTVYFSPGVIYSYTLANTDSHGNPLTKGTALLYSMFADGTLPGYNYTVTSVRNHDAGLLQSAIWGLQSGHLVYNNLYSSWAYSQLGSAIFDANDAYGVKIVQVWYGNYEAQNQLIRVPDSVNTIALLAISMAGLALVSQYRRQTGNQTTVV